MKSNKKAVIVILCIVACIVGVIAAALCVGFDNGSSIVLKDYNGTEFATASWDGYNLMYAVNSPYEKEYAVYAIDEAKNVFMYDNNIKEKDAYDYLFKNATEIRTNLNPSIQKILGDTYEGNLSLLNAACSMAVTDLNGRLTAVFSDGKEGHSALNKTYAGSTIKPLSVYAPAIDSGDFTWSYSVVDEPIKKVREQDGTLSDWPANSDGKYTHEKVCLADGIALSVNTVAVKTLQAIGVQNSVKILEDFYGINVDFEKSKLKNIGEDEILGNIALGYLYDGVTVADVAGYYQAFATGGNYVKPSAVDEMYKDGKIVYKCEYEAKAVMKTGTAAIMNKMLQRTVAVGTGNDARLDNVEVGGKTGTTTGNKDNWFVGYTPEYSCAVWHSEINEGNISPAIFGVVLNNLEHGVTKFSDNVNIESKLYCEKSGLLKGDKCFYCNKGYYLSSQNLEKCNECN